MELILVHMPGGGTSFVTIQQYGGTALRFDAGRAALQMRSVCEAAPHWLADLSLCILIGAVSSVAVAVVGAYITAMVNAGAWPVVTVQTAFALLVVLWLIVRYHLGERWLRGAIYATVGALAVSASLFLVWLTVYRSTRRTAPVAYWLLISAMGMQTLCALGAAIALGSLHSCARLTHAHHSTQAAIVQRQRAQMARGDAGDGVREPRAGAGAMAMADAADAPTGAAKKKD